MVAYKYSHKQKHKSDKYLKMKATITKDLFNIFKHMILTVYFELLAPCQNSS